MSKTAELTELCCAAAGWRWAAYYRHRPSAWHGEVVVGPAEGHERFRIVVGGPEMNTKLLDETIDRPTLIMACALAVHRAVAPTEQKTLAWGEVIDAANKPMERRLLLDDRERVPEIVGELERQGFLDVKRQAQSIVYMRPGSSSARESLERLATIWAEQLPVFGDAVLAAGAYSHREFTDDFEPWARRELAAKRQPSFADWLVQHRAPHRIGLGRTEHDFAAGLTSCPPLLRWLDQWLVMIGHRQRPLFDERMMPGGQVFDHNAVARALAHGAIDGLVWMRWGHRGESVRMTFPFEGGEVELHPGINGVPRRVYEMIIAGSAKMYWAGGRLAEETPVCGEPLTIARVRWSKKLTTRARGLRRGTVEQLRELVAGRKAGSDGVLYPRVFVNEWEVQIVDGSFRSNFASEGDVEQTVAGGAMFTTRPYRPGECSFMVQIDLSGGPVLLRAPDGTPELDRAALLDPSNVRLEWWIGETQRSVWILPHCELAEPPVDEYGAGPAALGVHYIGDPWVRISGERSW